MINLKKIIKYILCLLLGILIGINLFNRHDVNRDGVVDARDYVKIKNYIMEKNYE